MKSQQIWRLVLLGILLITFLGGLAFSIQSAPSEVVLTAARAKDGGTLSPYKSYLEPLRNAHLFYNLLVNVDPAQNYKVVPGLVSSWEAGDGYESFILHVRQGVKFHDGTPWNAKALKFTLEMWMNNPELSFLKWASVGKNVEIIDPYTVKIILKERFPLMIKYFSNEYYLPISPTAIKNHATEDDPYASKWLSDHECGTGPFILETWKPGEKLVARKWEDYWGGQPGIKETPKVDKLVYLTVPDPSVRMMMLEKGDIDVAIGLTRDMYDKLEEREHIKVEEYTMPMQTMLNYDVSAPPFNDIKVRKAIHYAINYQEIIDIIERGYAQKLCGIPPKGMLGASPELANYYTYDLEKAKKLMKESSYPNGFETTLMYSPDRYAAFDDYAIYIQSYLREIGIKVNIEKVTLTQQLARHKEGDYGLSLMTWTGTGTAVSADHVEWHYSSVKETYGWQAHHWVSSVTENLVPQAAKTADPEKRAEMFKEIERIQHEMAIVVYLTQLNAVIAMDENIHNMLRTACYEEWWWRVEKK